MREPAPLLATLPNRHWGEHYRCPPGPGFVGLENEMAVSHIEVERVMSHQVADQLAQACREGMNDGEEGPWLDELVAEMAVLFHFTRYQPLEAQLIALMHDPASKQLSANTRQQLTLLLSNHHMIALD